MMRRRDKAPIPRRPDKTRCPLASTWLLDACRARQRKAHPCPVCGGGSRSTAARLCEDSRGSTTSRCILHRPCCILQRLRVLATALGYAIIDAVRELAFCDAGLLQGPQCVDWRLCLASNLRPKAT